MSNADIFIEMIRLGEQIGKVVQIHLYANDYGHIEGETKDGKEFYMGLTIKEGNKDA